VLVRCCAVNYGSYETDCSQVIGEVITLDHVKKLDVSSVRIVCEHSTHFGVLSVVTVSAHRAF
jgi:hypothetical protein